MPPANAPQGARARHASGVSGVAATSVTFLALHGAPGEMTPFCPDVPSTLEATIDGHVLERRPWDVLFGCPEIAWGLDAETWPTLVADDHAVVVTDGESSFVMNTPFSLTRPPTWLLDDATFQPGLSTTLTPTEPFYEEFLITSAAIKPQSGQNLAVDVTHVDGSVLLAIPDDAVVGAAELILRFHGETDIECDEIEYCEASIDGNQSLDIWISAP